MASIYKRNGKWAYQIRTKDIDGNPVHLSKSGFARKAEAQLEAAKKEQEIIDGYRLKSEATFADVAKRWLELYKKDKIGPSHYKRYMWMVNRFEQVLTGPIREVTAGLYQEALNEIGKTLKRATVSKYHQMATAVFNFGIRERLVLFNPTIMAQMSGDDTPDKRENDKYLTQTEAQELMQLVRDDERYSLNNRTAIGLSLLTGLRYGEVMGLKWDDIDFKEKTLSVRRAYHQHEKVDGDTKTPSSKRTISLNDDAIALLDKLRLQRAFEAHVFDQVTSISLNKTLKRLLIRIDCEKDFTFHGLRHTHASLLINNNADLLYVSKRLGHSSLSITLDTYTHIIDELDKIKDKQAMEILTSATTLQPIFKKA